MVSSMSFADTVTFTAGTDKGSCAATADSPAGEDNVTKDGITVSTSNGAFAAVNYNTKAGEYRFYKSSTATISSSVGNITKVVFTCTTNGTAKYGPGNFTDATTGTYTFETDGATGTWTGDAESFSLTASGNQVRATKIEVTYTPNGEAPAKTVGAPTISGTTPFTDETTVTITAAEGTTVYYSTDGQDPDDREGTEYKNPFTLTETTTVKAIAYDADGNQSSVVSKEFVKQAATTGAGTKENPYTATDAVAMHDASTMPSAEAYYKGTITGIKTSSDNIVKYGNCDYYIATGTDTVIVFRGLYLGNVAFTAGDQIKEGDEVVVYGKLVDYKGDAELDKGNYIYSLNGKTASDTPVTIPDVANIAAFKDIATSSKANLTLKDAKVVYAWTSNNGNTSVYVRDASGALDFYNTGLELSTNDVINGTVILKKDVYNNLVEAVKTDETSADKLTITSSSEEAEPKAIEVGAASDNVSDLVEISNVDIKTVGSKYYAYNAAGDSLQIYDGFHLSLTLEESTGATIKGIIAQYKSTYEIYPIENPTTGINVPVKVNATDDRTFNLAGQRVSKAYKGVVIKGGKKLIQK